jgi:hypothetical protein
MWPVELYETVNVPVLLLHEWFKHEIFVHFAISLQIIVHI